MINYERIEPKTVHDFQPEFTVLAQHWLRLQDLILLLSEINVVNEELMKFADSIQSWEDIAYVLLGDNQIESDAERTKRFQNFKIDFFAADVSVLKYSSEMKVNFDQPKWEA